MKTELVVTGPVRQAAEQQKQHAAERDGASQTLGLWLAAVNGIVKSHDFPPVLLSDQFLSSLCRLNCENYWFAARSAASTTWLARIVLVTVPTPPGTGVMASTTGSTSAKRVSPQRLPSAPTWMPTSSTT